LFLLFITPK